MTTKTNSFEGTTVGAIVTTDTGGTSGDQITLVRGGTSQTNAVSTGAIFGSRSLELVCESGQGTYAYWSWGSITSVAIRATIYIPSTPSATTNIIQVLQASGGANAILVRASADGYIRVLDSTNATLWTSAAAVSYPATIQYDLTYNRSTGAWSFAAYTTGGARALGMSADASGTAATCANALNTVNVGKVNGTTWAPTLRVDEVKSADVYGLLGAYTPPAPPVAGLVKMKQANGTWVEIVPKS